MKSQRAALTAGHNPGKAIMASRRFMLAMLFVAGFVTCMSALRADEPPRKKGATNDSKFIQGTWVVVELQQINHEATQEEKEFLKKGGYKITFTGKKMIHSPDKSEGRYRLDMTKTPRVLELLEDGKVVAKAIYELKGDDLKFCQGRKPIGRGDPEPPTDFDIKKAVPGTFPTLVVLKRETSKPAEKK
jgi:uncharacterized protein (TIGR03067 family)